MMSDSLSLNSGDASPSESSRLWVLGAGGFLGSHLVETLARNPGLQITAVDTSFAKLPPLSEGEERIKRIQASVADRGLLDAAVDESDAILSLTALCNPALYNTRPVEVIDANYTHLVPLVERCAAQGRWLIHFSTCEVYGKPYPQPDGALLPMEEDETPLVFGSVSRQRWTYACAKQLLERLIWGYGAEEGLPFTILRPFNVIGPRMDFLDGVDGDGTPRVLASFMKALLAEEPLYLVDGGEQRRAFIAVEDFTEAVIRVLGRRDQCSGKIINIGHPENDVTIGDLAQRMAEVFRSRHGGRLHREIRIEVMSAEAFYGEGYDDTIRRIPNITRAQKLLSWEPKLSLDAMLPGIIDDYVTRYGHRVGFAGAEER